MNIFSVIREHIITHLNELVSEGVLPDDISFDGVTAEPPRDASHGDIATNAALIVAKPASKNPREIAGKLLDKINSLDEVASAEIAGPGFINITLEISVFHKIIADVLEAGIGYGNSDLGKGAKINIEYVSVNPTGPLHIGHARGAALGDVLAGLLLKAGYDITREYYINDAGGQVDVLARSAYLRYKEALGIDIGEIPEGLYPGDYLKSVGESFAITHERDYLHVSEEKWLPVIREFALESMMAIIRDDLQQLGITYDVFTSEKALVDSGAVEKGIKVLQDQDLVYRGTLEPPKGKLPDDWEPREQLLFKSTDFGDDVDRALKKSDDSGTYFASDIAYHHDKISRGFNEMIVTLGADHGGYVKRLKACVSALSDKKANIDVLLYQLVNFMEGGKPLKMSKRAGNYITVRDVVDAVGKDVIRFIMLTRKAEAIIDFDLKKVTEQSKDNPVFYVQYAHARICSVLRKSVEAIPELKDFDYHKISAESLGKLTNPHELNLIKSISEWPRIVENAARAREPHRIAFYLQELAASFHSLWNAGKEDVGLRFIMEDDIELTKARLALVKSCALTIASGLTVMGIEPVMEM